MPLKCSIEINSNGASATEYGAKYEIIVPAVCGIKKRIATNFITQEARKQFLEIAGSADA